MLRIRFVMVALVALVCAGLSSGVAWAVGPHDVRGHLDEAGQTDFAMTASGDGQTHVRGWAADPDLGNIAGITVLIYVDEKPPVTTYTGTPRPDVQRVFPQFGPNTGFDTTIVASVGTHRVCATAVNRGEGVNTSLGCLTATLRYHNALQGHIDQITVSSTTPQTVTFRGWALDPLDPTSAPLNAAVEQGLTKGQSTSPLVRIASFTTGLPRPDVAVYYPRGGNSGFSFTTTVQNAGLNFQSGTPMCIATTVFSSRFPPGSILVTALAPVCTTFP